MLSSNPILPLTPPGDVPDQVKRQRPVIGKPDSTFACLIFLQPVRECFHGFRARVQTDVFFGGSELYQIVFFPVSGHAPRDLFFGIWKSCFYGVVDLPEIKLDVLWLPRDIFFDGLRRLTAVVALIGGSEGTTAFWTLPG